MNQQGNLQTLPSLTFGTKSVPPSDLRLKSGEAALAVRKRTPSVRIRVVNEHEEAL